GGAPPVDAGERFALDIGTELPEIFTGAAFAASVPAVHDGVDHALRFHQQIGDGGCPRTGAGQRILAICGGNFCADDHQTAAFTRLAMTSRICMPSARAAKLSAMRCCRTGSASAFTSSTEGARRPS